MALTVMKFELTPGEVVGARVHSLSTAITTDRLLPWGPLLPKAWGNESSLSHSPSIRQIRLVICPHQSGDV
jgi:hypothetical protein